MKSYKIITFTLLIVMSITFVSSAQVQPEFDTDVDWINGYIQATGMAVPPNNISSEAQGIVLAREGAIVTGRARILEYLKGVYIDEKTTVVNMMANSKINQSVNGYIRGTYIVDGSGNWDGKIYSIKLRKDLAGFYRIVYKKNKDDFTNDKPTKETSYTGLVIDARNVNLNPQVMFKIIDESGSTIYNSTKAYYQSAIDKGLTGYAPSVQDAVNNSRTGSKPMVVKAVAATGENNTVVVVSNEDAQRIKRLISDTKIFRKAKIMVVME